MTDPRALLRRFRVTERGTKDGYNTAVVEFLTDEVPTGQDLEGTGSYLCYGTYEVSGSVVVRYGS